MTLSRLSGTLNRLQATGKVWFLLSALSAAAIVAACDNGGASPPAPTAPVAQGATATSGQGTQGGSAIERGQAIFTRYCNVCHPGGGRGAGPALQLPASSWTDEDIHNIVRNGKERMPPFGPSLISDEQLGDVIAYVRTFK